VKYAKEHTVKKVCLNLLVFHKLVTFIDGCILLLNVPRLVSKLYAHSLDEDIFQNGPLLLVVAALSEAFN